MGTKDFFRHTAATAGRCRYYRRMTSNTRAICLAPVLALVLGVAGLALTSCWFTPRSVNPWAGPGKSALLPASFRTSERHKEPLHTMRARVYVDREHATQARQWKESLQQQVDLANRVLIPEFGLQLEIADTQEWVRQAPSHDLPAVLTELGERDTGADVDLVIGLITPLSMTTSSIDKLAVSELMGRHIVLRGHNGPAERKQLFELTEDLGQSQREELYLVRKEHQQAFILLHEVGHTLGAIHVDPRLRSIMSASYDHKGTGFAEPTAALMRAVLAARMVPPAQRSAMAEWRALADHLAAAPAWPGWVGADHEQLKATAGARMEWLARQPQPAAEPDTSLRDIPAEARGSYGRAMALARAGELDAATSEIDALIGAYPAHIELRLAACKLALQKSGPDDAALRACKRVSELDPTDASAELTVAAAFAQAKNLAAAHAVLQGLIARMGELGSNAEATWATILALYQGMNAVTWTEAAVARAPPSIDTEPARSWAVSTRRRYGLPVTGSRFGITPEREGDYLQLVRTTLDMVYARQGAEARKLAMQGLKKFKNAPGLQGVLCDMELRAKKLAAARSRCRQALAGYDEASWPRYLLGIIELGYRKNSAGISHLQRAIAMDPDLRQAYHALYQAYRRVNDADGRFQLESTYLERFGIPIPKR